MTCEPIKSSVLFTKTMNLVDIKLQDAKLGLRNEVRETMQTNRIWPAGGQTNDLVRTATAMQANAGFVACPCGLLHSTAQLAIYRLAYEQAAATLHSAFLDRLRHVSWN
jgi:hypothetical protein